MELLCCGLCLCCRLDWFMGFDFGVWFCLLYVDSVRLPVGYSCGVACFRCDSEFVGSGVLSGCYDRRETLVVGFAVACVDVMPLVFCLCY